MKPPQRVVWTEGLFMCPQHLQQQDLYHERLLDARLGALVPYSWGAVEIEIDQSALAAGELRLARFIGVLPDGLSLAFERGDEEAPAARPIEGHFPASQRELEVYLGVLRERDGVVNYTDEGATSSIRTRFRVARRNVTDAAGTAAEVAVPYATRNVEILFGDEPSDDFEAIKVAEIVRDKMGSYLVNDTYIPPCLRIGASPFVVAGLRRLLVMMMAKQRELADLRRHRDAATVEFRGTDITGYLQLGVINTYIPVLNHLAEAGDMSPHQTYLFLIQMAGHLMTFSADADPSKLPPFLYTNLRQTFEELFARVTGLLHSTVRERVVSVPLEVKQGMHVGRLDDERLAQCQEFVLAVGGDVPESQTVEHLPKLSKIAALSQIGHIVRSATPGVPITVTHRPPPEVPVRPGLVYFTLATSEANWQAVIREKAIAIFLPPPFDPKRTSIQLMGIPLAPRP